MSAPRKQPTQAVTGIFPRGDRWCARVPVARHASGSGWKYRTVTAPTRDEALARAAKVEWERDLGRYRHLSSTWGFDDWARFWLFTVLRQEGRSQSTIDRHWYALDTAREWFLDRPIRKITETSVTDYYRSLRDDGFAEWRLRQAEISLRLCLATAADLGCIRRNPAAGAMWWRDQ